MKTLVKWELIVAAISFGLIFLSGVAGHLVALAGADQKTADLVAHASIFVFFCLFGFSCLGLMLHFFILLETGMGNGNAFMIRFLARNEIAVSFVVWGFLGVGALLAMPFVLFEDTGFQIPLRPNGVMSADIGMTIEEVRQRSTLKMKDPLVRGDGSYMSVEQKVFEFQIGDSPVRFPKARFYWLESPKHDTHITVLNIGITPQKMLQPELDAFQHAAQTLLFANGCARPSPC